MLDCDEEGQSSSRQAVYELAKHCRGHLARPPPPAPPRHRRRTLPRPPARIPRRSHRADRRATASAVECRVVPAPFSAGSRPAPRLSPQGTVRDATSETGGGEAETGARMS